MPDTMEFYTNPMSRGRIARWMLEEVGEPYQTHILDYGTSMKAPDYLAINPMGKVPALRHNGKTVTECAAICAYLADAFPDAGLAPPLDARDAYYRWMFFAAGPFECAVVNKSLGFEVPAERERNTGYGNLKTATDALTTAVSGSQYITGDRFTAADVYVGAQIGWGLQFDTIEKRPEFVDYWARISDREAFRRASEIDNALMPRDDG